jgi:hypothetical protein
MFPRTSILANVAMNFLKIMITHDEFLDSKTKLPKTEQELTEGLNSTKENSSATNDTFMQQG